MKKNSTLSGRQGFSLVELLVVIAVIGIIAAIAIPNIANITSNATFAKSQRNAQNIVSVANAAIAAGYTNGWATKAEMISVLTSATGVVVTPANSTNSMTFSISQLNSTEQGATTNFITFTAPTTVGYVPGGISTN